MVKKILPEKYTLTVVVPFKGNIHRFYWLKEIQLKSLDIAFAYFGIDG